ncbi:MAG: hypothetical protein AB1473_18470 [Thermodesulfobacteriota bacterium]
MAYVWNEWCWIEEKCECRKSSDPKILENARNKFNNLDYEYKYYGWFGLDVNLNGKKEVNCWFVVSDALQSRGFYGPPLLGAFLRESKYFCRVPYEDAEPGDIVNFYPTYLGGVGHVSILSSKKNVDGVWQGTHFTAQNPSQGIKDLPWSTVVSPTDPQWVEGIYRPKDCVRWIDCAFPQPPEDAPARRHDDPLILDLNGDGVNTVGLSAGIHFDQDGNEFKELTGWVAPGDGILMLDRNGNGRLDDASELFGDLMVLPDGMTTGNGFAALAYYDANSDGKIDYSDPIWSQLKLWEHGDYQFFQGGG